MSTPTALTENESTIDRLIASRTPVISINSAEEARVEASLAAVAQGLGMEVWVWSATDGMQPLTIGATTYAAPLPYVPWGKDAKLSCALLYMLGVVRFWNDLTSQKDAQGNITTPNPHPALFIFRDALPTLLAGQEARNDTAHTALRAIRDLARDLPLTDNTVVFLQPHAYIPDAIEKDVRVLDWALPNTAELDSIVESLIQTANVPVEINGSRPALIRNLAGLTANEAVQVLSMAITTLGKVDTRAIQFVLDEKAKVINANKDIGIEYWPGQTFDSVGGYAGAKAAMLEYEARYSDAAATYGLGPGRGLILFGVQGGGKTAMAKCFGNGKRAIIYWNPNASQSKWVGDTDKNMRKVFAIAEAVGNVTLLIDEGGKQLAGGESAHDGGTKIGQLGALCTWMEERARKFGVFVLLTTNEARLDPALVRRFDDTFFFDLPERKARRAIFGIHLQKRAQTFGVSEAVISSTSGYTGAEIEKVVEKAMSRAFGDGQRLLTDADFDWACPRVIPISKQQQEVVEAMRHAAEGRCLDAETGLPYGSSPAPAAQSEAIRRLKVRA